MQFLAGFFVGGVVGVIIAIVCFLNIFGDRISKKVI